MVSGGLGSLGRGGSNSHVCWSCVFYLLLRKLPRGSDVSSSFLGMSLFLLGDKYITQTGTTFQPLFNSKGSRQPARAREVSLSTHVEFAQGCLRMGAACFHDLSVHPPP